MKRKWYIFIILMFIFADYQIVYGVENETLQYGYSLSDYNFDEIQKSIDDSEADIDFRDTVNQLQNSDTSWLKMVIANCINTISTEYKNNWGLLIQIFGLALISTFVNGFANIFGNSQIGSTGFYVIYIFLTVVLMNAFLRVITMAAELISILVGFMKALMPVYFMAVGVAGNAGSAMAVYEITMIIVMVIEWLFLNIVIPFLKMYVAIVLVNNMSKEQILSKFTTLMKRFLNWTMKAAIAAVTGINLIEGMILPSVDSATVSAVSKFTQAIPGIGSGVNSMTGLALGAGNLIKNSLGAAGLVAIFVISIIPIVRVGIVGVMCHILSAIVQPVADKQITDSISDVADAMSMSLKVVMTAIVLIVIIIAVVCISTNQTYYAVS